MKKFEQLENSPYQLKIELYYHLGGTNYFTSTNEERGYYLSISPVKRSITNGIIIEEYTAFSGLKKLILPVKKKSEKAYQLAIKESSEWIDIIKEKVLNKIKG